MPRIAVIVPAYNASATLAETLDGMLAQESADWECVIVDDGSTDATAAIAQQYVDKDARYRLISQQNTGTAGAYRTGIAAADASLLSICASDDILLPAHCKVMSQLVTENPDCGLFSSNGVFLYDDTGERVPAYTTDEWMHHRSLTFEQVLQKCFFSVGAVFRREVFDLTGGHRKGVYTDDYDLWLRAMARGVKHCYTPEVLAVHRVSSFQQSANLVRVYDSDLEVFSNLLAEGTVQPEHLGAVEAAIERTRRLKADEVARLALERQATGLRHSVERAVGPSFAPAVLRAIHSFSWITRPLRRLVAGRRSGR